MMVMTARVNPKLLIWALVAVALAALLGALLLGGSEAAPTGGSALASNRDRVEFLASLGWDAAASPTESGQVRIPEGGDEVFDRYNALQKAQGYDLAPYGGQTALRYVYRLKNYPGATDPVYATLLILEDRLIGGDITDTSPGGVIQGLIHAPGDTLP